MSTEKYINVKNRSASMVVYTIPEENIRREFAPSETKRLPYSELEKLTYQPGGRMIMANFLQLADEESLNNFNIKTEPEYNMSEQDIVKLLQEGSVDALLDALDFAPVGVVDLIKQYAVSLPLNDYNKREAIKQKTGFDVSKSVDNNAAAKEDEAAEATAPTRRVAVEEKPAIPAGRRTAPPKYNVVSKGAAETATDTANTEG